MGFENVEEIGTDERLTAGNGDEIDSHLLPLPEYPVDHFCFQFLPFWVLAGITTVTVQVAPHGGAENHEKGRIEPVPGAKFFPLGVSGDELIDNEVLGEFSQAIFGTSTDGPPAMQEEALEKLLPFRIIGDSLQSSADDGELQEPPLADIRKDFEDGFCGLDSGELLETTLGFHPASPLRVLTGSFPYIQRVKA
jgi:hypothetical protein